MLCWARCPFAGPGLFIAIAVPCHPTQFPIISLYMRVGPQGVQGVTADGRGGVAYEPKVTSAFDGGAERACDSITTRCSMSLPPHALMLSCSPKCPSLQILPIVPRRAAIAVQRERVR